MSDGGSKKEAGSGCGCDRGVWKAFHGGSLVEARWTARHENLLFLHVWWPPQQPVLLLLLLPPPGFRHPASPSTPLTLTAAASSPLLQPTPPPTRQTPTLRCSSTTASAARRAAGCMCMRRCMMSSVRRAWKQLRSGEAPGHRVTRGHSSLHHHVQWALTTRRLHAVLFYPDTVTMQLWYGRHMRVSHYGPSPCNVILP